MRATIRAIGLALVLGLLLAADVMAKGEQASAVIGPIDDIDAGTPTPVTATITVDGKPMTNGSFPAMLDFYEPVTRMAIDFPLRYDRAAGTWTTTVTLPYKGRWLVEAVMRASGGGFSESFGSSTGTRVVTVNAAHPASPPASPIGPVALGAGAASALWLLGLSAYVLRRRRVATTAARRSIGEQLPA